ncbi:nitrogen regulation protein NR(II) [Elusimicrobiota bacterium]
MRMPSKKKILFNEAVINAISGGIIGTDINNRVIVSNNAAEIFFGFSKKELSGKCFDELGELSELKNLLIITIASQKEQIRKEIIVQDRTGKKTLIGCSTSILKNENGEVLGAMAVFRDLSRIYRDRKKQNYLKRLALIGESTAGIAHELKNPLAIISGLSQNMNKYFSDQPDKVRESAGKIIEEVDRITNIIDDVRRVTKTGSADFEPIPVNNFLDVLINDFQFSLVGKDIILKKNLKIEQDFIIMGAKGLLEQLLINLMNNAVEAFETSSGEILLYAYQKSEHLLLKICDNGPGIPEDLKDKISEPFFTTKKQGTGLGLSICKRIVKLHNGRMHIKSDSSGTEILLEFPSVNLE